MRKNYTCTIRLPFMNIPIQISYIESLDKMIENTHIKCTQIYYINNEV